MAQGLLPRIWEVTPGCLKAVPQLCVFPQQQRFCRPRAGDASPTTGEPRFGPRLADSGHALASVGQTWLGPSLAKFHQVWSKLARLAKLGQDCLPSMREPARSAERRREISPERERPSATLPHPTGQSGRIRMWGVSGTRPRRSEERSSIQWDGPAHRGPGRPLDAPVAQTSARRPGRCRSSRCRFPQGSVSHTAMARGDTHARHRAHDTRPLAPHAVASRGPHRHPHRAAPRRTPWLLAMWQE